MPTPGPLPRRHHAPGPSWSGSRRSTAPAPSGTTSSRITARTCAPPSSTRPSLSAEPSRRAPRFLLFRILLPYESRQEEGQRRGGEDPRADESGPGQDGDAGLRDRDGQEERRQEKVHGRHAPRGPSRRRWPWARRLPRHDIPGRSVQVDEPRVEVAFGSRADNFAPADVEAEGLAPPSSLREPDAAHGADEDHPLLPFGVVRQTMARVQLEVPQSPSPEATQLVEGPRVDDVLAHQRDSPPSDNNI
mmetsp:Transcript_18570/g.59961  ORF Transcript_18570/g.59961 Transcript_18570/m.59961 type:complete len:247 (+) Transcript_18570:1159-1899(+)